METQWLHSLHGRAVVSALPTDMGQRALKRPRAADARQGATPPPVSAASGDVRMREAISGDLCH